MREPAPERQAAPSVRWSDRNPGESRACSVHRLCIVCACAVQAGFRCRRLLPASGRRENIERTSCGRHAPDPSRPCPRGARPRPRNSPRAGPGARGDGSRAAAFRAAGRRGDGRADPLASAGLVSGKTQWRRGVDLSRSRPADLRDRPHRPRIARRRRGGAAQRTGPARRREPHRPAGPDRRAPAAPRGRGGRGPWHRTARAPAHPRSRRRCGRGNPLAHNPLTRLD